MAIDKSRERDIVALRREGEQYLAAGMLDRVLLVNAELKVRGADAIDVPVSKPRQTRQSTQASTRRKADS